MRYGLPFVLLCAGGYYALSQFVGTKYEAIDSRIKKRSERTAVLEEEHKKIMAKLNSEELVLKPVPPPKDDAGLRKPLK
jgi:Cytochrome c oxidase assembly protein COX16